MQQTRKRLGNIVEGGKHAAGKNIGRDQGSDRDPPVKDEEHTPDHDHDRHELENHTGEGGGDIRPVPCSRC